MDKPVCDHKHEWVETGRKLIAISRGDFSWVEQPLMIEEYEEHHRQEFTYEVHFRCSICGETKEEKITSSPKKLSGEE